MNVIISRQDLTQDYAVALVTVMQENAVVASLTLYENPHINFKGYSTMLFGDLQLPDNNTEAVALLFQQADAEAKAARKPALLGPINGSTWQSFRLPLEGNEPLFAGDLAMPSSWADYVQAAGFRIVDSYRSSIAPLIRGSHAPVPAGVSVQPVSEASLSADLPSLHSLCMEAFAGAPYFSPLAESEFVKQFSKIGSLLSAGFSYTARQNDKVIAFVFAYPDTERNAIVIKTIARHPTIWVRDLMHTLLDIVCVNAYKKGFTQAVHAFMHDHNRSLKHSSDFGGKLLRRYALFAKVLNN
jgi:hypothetical protein